MKNSNIRTKLVLIFLLSGLLAIIGMQLARYFVILWSSTFENGSWYATYHDFRLIHLQVNYFEHGYLRRGLVGTFLYFFGIDDVKMAGWLLSIGSILLFFGVIGFVAAEITHERRKIIYAILIIMIFGPVGVSQFVLDAGRIDHLLLPLLSIATILGLKGKLTLSAVLFFVMCLIHELSVVAFTPLLVVSNMIGSRQSLQLSFLQVEFPFCTRSVFVFLLISIAVVAITFSYGESSRAVSSFSVSDGEKAFYSDMVWGVNSPIHMVSWRGMSTFLLILYYMILIGWGLMYYRSIPGFLVLLPLSTVSCVFLNFLGVDAGRWAAITTWTVLISIVAAEFVGKQKLSTQFPPNSFIYLSFLLAAPVGPVGVTVPFTFFGKLISDFIF